MAGRHKETDSRSHDSPAKDSHSGHKSVTLVSQTVDQLPQGWPLGNSTGSPFASPPHSWPPRLVLGLPRSPCQCACSPFRLRLTRKPRHPSCTPPPASLACPHVGDPPAESFSFLLGWLLPPCLELPCRQVPGAKDSLSCWYSNENTHLHSTWTCLGGSNPFSWGLPFESSFSELGGLGELSE